MQTITIDIELYYKLLHDSHVLNTLKNHGVDNWEGYGDALEDANVLIEKIFQNINDAKEPLA